MALENSMSLTHAIYLHYNEHTSCLGNSEETRTASYYAQISHMLTSGLEKKRFFYKKKKNTRFFGKTHGLFKMPGFNGFLKFK